MASGWRLGSDYGGRCLSSAASDRQAAAGAKPQTDKMDWSKKKYQVQLENGDQESVTGISNGLFGLSADGVLTHLPTGYRVARFPDQQSGKAAGDYLAAAYAEEFNALNKAFRKSMTYEQYRSLSEAADLNAKVTGDRDFNRLLAAAGLERTGGG